MAKPNPLSALKVSKHFIPAYNPFPNSPHRPLLIYHACFPNSTTASQVESHLESTGVVKPQWRFPMYREHHFHSTTHEVLVVVKGSARLCFGGRDNPKRVEHDAEKGDLMVVPAGLAHAMLEDTSGGGFEMVGSYPVGAKNWDHCTSTERGVEERIAGLGWFELDPVYGDHGPVLEDTA